ncbi:hypothetical protein ACFLV0_07410 [Chloroflexota bacterium]
MKVVGTFALAIALHALWNIVNSLGGSSAGLRAIVIFGNLAVATVSLTLLIRRVRESRNMLPT